MRPPAFLLDPEAAVLDDIVDSAICSDTHDANDILAFVEITNQHRRH
jgi:hypothetical protein